MQHEYCTATGYRAGTLRHRPCGVGKGPWRGGSGTHPGRARTSPNQVRCYQCSIGTALLQHRYTVRRQYSTGRARYTASVQHRCSARTEPAQHRYFTSAASWDGTSCQTAWVTATHLPIGGNLKAERSVFHSLGRCISTDPLCRSLDQCPPSVGPGSRDPYPWNLENPLRGSLTGSIP